jgi:hypothetical protein
MSNHSAIFQYLLLLVIAGLLLVFCYHTIPDGNQRYVDVLLGAIIGAFTTSAIKDANNGISGKRGDNPSGDDQKNL